MYQPLADKLRPTSFKEVIGNDRLIGVLENLIKKDRLTSLILYGATGVGKTTLAKIIASYYPLNHFNFNASTDNKKSLREIIEAAKMYDKTLLIIDEIHRMNRDIQDYLLPYVEKGIIIMIGLTTENPYIAVNPAVRSRVSIYKLTKPSTEQIESYLKSLDLSSLLPKISIDDFVYHLIAVASNNEVRSAINMLELIINASDQTHLTIDEAKKYLPQAQISAFKTGDDYYDVLSAFHKSVRGSDVNAALYYLARLLAAGDLKSLVRRIKAIVYEDIGLASPMMGVKVHAACSIAEEIGLPEAYNALSAITIDMCISPKSNAAHLAIGQAAKDVEEGKTYQVPSHLINNPTYDNAKDYKYAHDYPNHIVNQDYLPKELQGKVYYQPQTHTKIESAYAEEYKKNEKIIKAKKGETK
ncbi:MAG: replication-associated recombination protein A [Tenericutes bacterium]|jgi:putative ATPase|nr:replication-associated recombination protein A [Mycoplasmatota bacterium]